jgi:hypothetical protein
VTKSATAILVSAALVGCTTMGDRISPITGEIMAKSQGHDWGYRVDLVGSKFDAGEAREVAETRLSRNGFSRAEREALLRFLEVDESAAVFHKDGAMVACSLDYYVVLGFDRDDRVTEAHGAMYASGCL